MLAFQGMRHARVMVYRIMTGRIANSYKTYTWHPLNKKKIENPRPFKRIRKCVLLNSEITRSIRILVSRRILNFTARTVTRSSVITVRWSVRTFQMLFFSRENDLDRFRNRHVFKMRNELFFFRVGDSLAVDLSGKNNTQHEYNRKTGRVR